MYIGRPVALTHFLDKILSVDQTIKNDVVFSFIFFLAQNNQNLHL